MILFDGKTYPSSEQDRLIGELAPRLTAARETPPDPEPLIRALDTLAGRIAAGEYDALIDALDLPDRDRMVREAVWMLQEEQLRRKMAVELPPLPETPGLAKRRLPLGVLFHIAAGNLDVLPAYSVIEGLLAGNINILKLPGGDNGLTVRVLEELIALCPQIRDYLYVFDTSSRDLEAMKALAALAGGIVVWGGEEAVRAVRALAPANARIIEWGHKLSFAYLTPSYTDADLTALAVHIRETRQTLCSSAQVIYLDTADMAEVLRFCERFLPVLDGIYGENDLSHNGKMTLQSYTARLREAAGQSDGSRLFRGRNVLLTASPDSRLEVSDMFGSIRVKPLPREQIVPVLAPHKSRLQTAGLAVREEDLVRRLALAGVTRITSLASMSRPLPGENHDGTYALAAYTRIVDVEE
nr:acyl-CoA reductase [Lachnospiraceae bacterium]